MRIVTGDAANAAIERVVTLAVGQAVRRETHVADSSRTLGGYVCPSSVTLPAGFRHLLCVEIAEVRHARYVRVTFSDRGHMRLTARVAVATLNAWSELVAHLSCAMATEALHDIAPSHFAARSFDYIARRRIIHTQRQIKPVHLLEKANPALVAGAIPLVDIRLACST
jgi:hypothetical protein